MNQSTPLDEIKAFVDVAEAGSFTAAANVLNVAHSSLSRKVLHLEQWLGEQLFQRTSSGVVLTAAGTRHFQRFSEALEIIRGSVASAPRYEVQRPVQVSCVPGVCTALLLPNHRDLCSDIEGLAIRYALDRRLTDFNDGTDLAVRSGSGHWRGLRSALLLPTRVRPFASIEIAQALGQNPSPAQLLAYPLVHLAVETAWRTWIINQGVPYTVRPQDHVLDDVSVVSPAVRHGLGIGLYREGIDPDPASLSSHFVAEKPMILNSGFFLVRPNDKPLRQIAQRYAQGLMKALHRGSDEIEDFVAQ